jgi:amino acid adenylation domain-containing protein
MTARHLAEYLDGSAGNHPDRIAVVESGGTKVTYTELRQQADALAAFLQSRGIGRGDRVGIVLPKSIAAMVAFFGVLKAGAAYVPLDAAAPAARSRRILADCAVSALIVCDGAEGLSSALTDEDAMQLRAVLVDGAPGTTGGGSAVDFRNVVQSDATPVAIETSPDDLAYIIYTSGSTGTPKGAMITHRNAISYIDWCSSLLTPTADDQFSSHPPFHFDASVQDIYLTARHGATVHLISEELGKKPRELMRFIADRRLTIWTSTPSALMLLLQFGDLPSHDASALRVVMFGGDVFPVKHLRELKRHWTSAVFYNVYGPTETTTTCTFGRIPDVVPEDRTSPYPIGFPCEHCTARVLDRNGLDVGAGEEGVLHIGGASVFAGYWARETETAAVLQVRDGQRWYNTGDVVRWDPVEGLTFVGRNDRMVKRRGYRIELAEIERALYEHPQLMEAAVVSVPDDDAGVRIVAFVACEAGAGTSIIELKQFCATKLPAWMSPDRFIIQDRLPLTSTDKVDYRMLTELLTGHPSMQPPSQQS